MTQQATSSLGTLALFITMGDKPESKLCTSDSSLDGKSLDSEEKERLFLIGQMNRWVHCGLPQYASAKYRIGKNIRFW